MPFKGICSITESPVHIGQKKKTEFPHGRSWNVFIHYCQLRVIILGIKKLKSYGPTTTTLMERFMTFRVCEHHDDINRVKIKSFL